jgi:sedoheptulokinase
VFLGIDLGTTTASAAIVDAGGRVCASASRAHAADLPCAAGRDEQDPARLLGCARETVLSLPAPMRGAVRAVGVTGQMHGVLLLDAGGCAVTPLITWRDGRCLEGEFLPDLSRRTGHRLRTGFGCATLAWLAARRLLPDAASCACTIQDLAVQQLCGERRAVTDPTDAASWGLFDLWTMDWDRQAVGAAGIRQELLPAVRPCGSRAGALCAAAAGELGLPAGVPVMTAIGDNQASLAATLTEPERELAVTIGTGAQASAVMPADAQLARVPPELPYELRPFPGGRLAVVAAALCGGAAWAWLVDGLNRILGDLGRQPLDRDDLFRRIDALGAEADAAAAPTVRPHFLGERHDPSLRGSVEGLTMDNLAVGPIARGLAGGIAANLKGMLPAGALAGRLRVVGSGNALRRSALLRSAVEEAFGLPLRMSEGAEEAAAGAAKLAGRLA